MSATDTPSTESLPPEKLTALIRDHYDGVSPLYQKLWGDHVHHGYWENELDRSSQARAQERLIEELVAFANVPRGARVLDVGCGLGGSSCWLAERMDCFVHGVTLSPVQAGLAARRAAERGLSARTLFEVRDANHLSLPDASFDVVWTVECSEHLFDKPAFLRNVVRLLKPGGVLAVAAWLDESRTEDGRRLIADIRDRMLCPSLGSRDDYRRWMRDAGLHVRSLIVSDHVARTWDLCARIAKSPAVRVLLPILDLPTRRFVDSFPLMQEGFRTGAFAYGLLAGRKGEPSPGTIRP